MIKYIYIYLVLTLVLSCTNNKEQRKQSILKPFEAIGITHQSDTAKPAFVTYLNSCPKPRMVKVPAKNMQVNVHYESGNNNLHLSPPVTKPINFIVPMPDYNESQGFSSEILDIFKDNNGNLWFCTDGKGVTCYDGTTYSNFTTAQGMLSNTVFCAYQDKKGKYWFGTYNGGVSCFDGNSIKTYTINDGLVDNSVLCITQDKRGIIWLGTVNGINSFDGNKFTTYNNVKGLKNQKISGITETRDGNIWFATFGSGVFCYNGIAFTNYTTDQGLASNDVRSICQDKNGNLWFGTEGAGVSIYDGKTFKTYTSAQGLGNNFVTRIYEANSGILWFATTNGVSRYDGERFSTYTTDHGLCNNHVTSITEDKGGNLWFGTRVGGVCRYDGDGFMTYNFLDKNRILCLFNNKKNGLWFASNGGGVNYYNGKTSTTYTTSQGLAENNFASIADDKKGNIWFGGYDHGVTRFDGERFTTFTTEQGIGSNKVFCIFEDSRGYVWFGTYGFGVSRYDGKSIATFTSAQGLASNNVNHIKEDKSGNLWLATNNGVSRFDGNFFTTYTTEQGLGNNYVNCIYVDKTGHIWFGTEGGGVSRFDGKTFTTYTKSQGFVNNSVTGIVEDKTGRIWFSTPEGICCLSGYQTIDNTKTNGKIETGKLVAASNSNNNPDLTANYTPVFETYNFGNGYPITEITNLSIDNQDIIWGVSGYKLVRFDYSALSKKTHPLTLSINRIKINNEKISWRYLKNNQSQVNSKQHGSTDSMAIINEEVNAFGGALSIAAHDTMYKKFTDIMFDSITPFYPIPLNLVLPYRHNNITFDFAAVEPAKPYLVNYKYILEGYDKEWSPGGNKTTVTFGNMHEGIYTFKLKAQSPDGIWSEPLVYTFKVLPPIYRTWWAYIVYSLFSICTLIGIFRWRTRTLIREKGKLETIVSERTIQLVNEKEQVEKQKKRSDELLLNILPEDVAVELKEKGSSAARYYDNVTVLFTDFVDFSIISEKMTPQALIDELHTCFIAFDQITSKYNIEKIKTIGDSYLAVAGLPIPDPQHAMLAVQAAKEIVDFMMKRYNQIGDKTFKIRVGIHSGNVVASIVGVKKFAYDIWGDTVNTAARMEQSSEAGKINISKKTYDLVKDKFNCTYRGEIIAKNKGLMDMYFVD